MQFTSSYLFRVGGGGGGGWRWSCRGRDSGSTTRNGKNDSFLVVFHDFLSLTKLFIFHWSTENARNIILSHNLENRVGLPRDTVNISIFPTERVLNDL